MKDKKPWVHKDTVKNWNFHIFCYLVLQLFSFYSQVTGCDVCGSRKNDCVFAGDFRVNEQINLIVLHTLFMREHNRVAAALARLNPAWSDDKLYQEARRITVAEYQHIIYKEWLPIILGNNLMTSYGLLPLSTGHSTDYMDTFDPRITNEFATAAFRFGHSLVPATYSHMPPTANGAERRIKLADIFFRPGVMKEAGFLDGLVRGMSRQATAAFDNSFVADLRNNLFESAPGRGGLDLVAINVQRGRDHGLPGYNKYREICLGQRATDWADLTNTITPAKVATLKVIYKSVDDVDLYVGGFLESPHEDSILGPIFKCILGDQFARLKKGDRFFYDLGVDARLAFSGPQLDQLRRTSLARIICDNTDTVTSIQPLAFKLPTAGKANALRPCTDPSIPTVDLSVFRDQPFF
jgi:peroxidase